MASQPVPPLCERPARHAVPLADLLAWREAAQQQAEAIGGSWLEDDPDGPTAEDLQASGLGEVMQPVGGVALPPTPLARGTLYTHGPLRTTYPMNPPTSTFSAMLQTELDWLLDDALAALARPASAKPDWRPTSWRQVERDLRPGGLLADAAGQYMVQLREPLETLGELWWSYRWAQLPAILGAAEAAT